MAEERWVMATDNEDHVVHINMANVTVMIPTTGGNKRPLTRLHFVSGETIRVEESVEHFLPPFTRER